MTAGKNILFLLLIICLLIPVSCKKKLENADIENDETEFIFGTYSERKEELPEFDITGIDLNQFLLGYWYAGESYYVRELKEGETFLTNYEYILFEKDLFTSGTKDRDWKREGPWKLQYPFLTIDLEDLIEHPGYTYWTGNWGIKITSQNSIEVTMKGVFGEKTIYIREDSEIKRLLDSEDTAKLKQYFLNGNIEEQMIFGLTPLKYAVIHGNADMVKFLLELGANPNIQDRQNRTTIDLTVLTTRIASNNYINLPSPNTARIRRILDEYGAITNNRDWQWSIDRTLYHAGEFKGHREEVYSVAYSPCGNKIASASEDRRIIIWDINTGKNVMTLTHNRGVTAIAYNSDGTKLISGSGNGEIKLWDTVTGNEIKTFTGHTRGISSIMFSNDDKQIISGSYDNTLRFWDIETGRELKSISNGRSSITSFAFSPDNKQIIVVSRRNDTFKLFDITTRAEVHTFTGHSHYVNSAAFSPDGRQIISGANDATIKLWDINDNLETITYLVEVHKIYSIAFSPDGKQVVSTSDDGTMRLWDVP